MTDVHDEVVEAEQAAKDAESLVVELEQRVVAGDDTVAAGDIEAQQGLARFAKLRVQAAERKRAAALRDQANARAAAAVEQAAAVDTLDAELVAAWRAAVAALVALADVTVERDDTVRRVRDELDAADWHLQREAGSDLTAHGLHPAKYGGDFGWRIPSLGQDVASVRSGDVIATAVEMALNGSRIDVSQIGPFDRQRPGALATSTLAGRVSGWARAVPGGDGPAAA